MRPFTPFFALALLANPAFSQVPAPPAASPGVTDPGVTSQAVTPPGPTVATPGPTTPAPKPHRLTAAQRFDAANATHDGKLTLAQAKAARFSAVVKSFAAIDKDHKGYVTKADITAYRQANKGTKPGL